MDKILKKNEKAEKDTEGSRDAPNKARKTAEDYDREARQEAVDRATSILIFRHFGKRGLRKKHNAQVIELTRVIRVWTFRLNSQTDFHF